MNAGQPFVQPTPGQINTQYDPAAFINNLYRPDYQAQVYFTDGGYNRYTIPLLVERIRAEMNGGVKTIPRMVEGRYGQYTIYLQGEMQIQAVTANAVNNFNGTITINWQDSSYADFRNSDRVINNVGTNVNALVVSANFTAGSITIGPIDDATPLSLGDWNVPGQTVNVIDNAQPIYSAGRAQLIQLPIPTSNYTMTLRETVVINRMDTALTYPVAGNGKPFIYAQQGLASDWLNKQLAQGILYGRMGLVNANSNNPTRTYMGLKQSIEDTIRGGVPELMTAMPLANDFETYWTTLANKRMVNKSQFLHVCGRDYLTMFQQTFSTPLIQPTGINNTLDRLVQGLDCYHYAVSGVDHYFVMEPALQDQGLAASNYSKLTGMTGMTLGSASCFTLDHGGFKSLGGQILPSMEQIYFGSQPIRLGVQRGMADDPFFRDGIDSRIGIEISTSQDNNTLQFLVDTGYNFVASNMGYHLPPI